MKSLIMSKEKRQRIIRQLHNHRFRIILIMILYPNIVYFTPESSDSSNTVIDFMLGLGKYSNVTYDCSGRATSIRDYSYIDYGGSISHKVDLLKFGVRGGGFSVDGPGEYYYMPVYPYESVGTGEQSVQYVNPFIAFDHKYVELSFGLVFLTEYPWQANIRDRLINDGTTQLSWLLRIGNRRAFHFSTHYLSNVPIFSGGGMFDMGLGIGSKKSRNITWLGLSVGPYQNAGFALKQNIQVTDNLDILIKGRIGQIESNLEGSISAGARYNF
jgi:hypothetical protein